MKLPIPQPHGFSLTELMIALVIFSIGLLPLMQFQLRSLYTMQSSLHQTTAQTLAEDMAARIRLNRTEALLGKESRYHVSTGSPHFSCRGLSEEGAVSNTHCTPAELAEHDLYEWKRLVEGSPASAIDPVFFSPLPQGKGIVCLDSTPHDGTALDPACDGALLDGQPVYAIKIFWQDRSQSTQQVFVLGVTP